MNNLRLYLLFSYSEIANLANNETHPLVCVCKEKCFIMCVPLTVILIERENTIQINDTFEAAEIEGLLGAAGT